PTDLKTNYIKRCIAIAGDTIAIRDMQVFINGKPAENPSQLQYSYLLVTDKVLNEKFFLSHNIPGAYADDKGYRVDITPEKAQELESLDIIEKAIVLKMSPGNVEQGILSQSHGYQTWNRDNFGPLYV